MFAFSIWDKKNKNLFLARDRFGKKPIVYSLCDNSISFSSYVSALSKISEAGNVDKDAVKSLFRFRFIHEPLTIYENFKKLPPGSYLKFNQYGPKIYKWYQIEDQIKFKKTSAIKEKKIFDLVIEAVDKRLSSDVPIGLFLLYASNTRLLGGIILIFGIPSFRSLRNKEVSKF